MEKEQVNEDGSISYSVWVKKGKMMVNRSALPPDDPDHIYNYIKAKFGVDPEEFGVEKPTGLDGNHICPNCGCRF